MLATSSGNEAHLLSSIDISDRKTNALHNRLTLKLLEPQFLQLTFLKMISNSYSLRADSVPAPRSFLNLGEDEIMWELFNRFTPGSY